MLYLFDYGSLITFYRRQILWDALQVIWVRGWQVTRSSMSGTEFQSLLFYHLSLIFISLIIVYFRSGHKEIFPIFQCLPFRIIRCTNNSESWHDKAFLRNTSSIQSIFSDSRFTCFLREQWNLEHFFCKKIISWLYHGAGSKSWVFMNCHAFSSSYGIYSSHQMPLYRFECFLFS